MFASVPVEASDRGSVRAPVFIVGQARSGSSILYRLLQSHARFAPTAGSNLSESAIMDVIAGERSLDVLSARAFATLDDEGWSALFGDLGMTERVRHVATRVPRRVLIAQPWLWAVLGCEATLRRYLAGAARARGAIRLVEKTPHHLPWVPHLVRAFPDARALCITRHPVHAFASYRRRASVEGPSSWAVVAPGAFVEHWRDEVKLIERWTAAHRDRFRLVSYERLVEDPDGEQRQLFGWLGEEPLAVLPGKEAADPYAPAADASMLYDEIKPTTAAWQTLLSDREVEDLEGALEPEMALLGYQPIGGAGPHLPDDRGDPSLHR